MSNDNRPSNTGAYTLDNRSVANRAIRGFVAGAILAAVLSGAFLAGAASAQSSDPTYPSYPNGEPERVDVTFKIVNTSGLVPCDPDARRDAIVENTERLLRDYRNGATDTADLQWSMLELAGGLLEIEEFGC